MSAPLPQSQAPAPRPATAVTSIAITLLGYALLVWVAVGSPWGEGGEIQGAALATTAVFAVLGLMVCALIGLTLAIAARRAVGPTRTVRVALWLSGLTVALVASVVILFRLSLAMID